MRLVTEHQQEYSSLNAASAAVARQLGVGTRVGTPLGDPGQIDAGDRPGITREENEEIKRLSAENRRQREDVAIRNLPHLSSRGTRPPQPLIMGFIDLTHLDPSHRTLRARRHRTLNRVGG